MEGVVRVIFENIICKGTSLSAPVPGREQKVSIPGSNNNGKAPSSSCMGHLAADKLAE